MVDLKLDTSVITWNVNITPPPNEKAEIIRLY